MKKLQKGFTLIELLVVIAIIGILSSIVLASLSSARSKGTDAAVQSALSNMRAQAELYYSNTNSYGPVTALVACPTTSANTNIFSTTTTGGLWTLLDDINKRTNNLTRCVVTANGAAWALSATTTASGSYCVDSSGSSRAGVAGAAGTCI